MRAIKEELGDNDDDEDDVTALERKMESAGMPPDIWKHAQRELRYTNLGTHSNVVYLTRSVWMSSSWQIKLLIVII